MKFKSEQSIDVSVNGIHEHWPVEITYYIESPPIRGVLTERVDTGVIAGERLEELQAAKAVILSIKGRYEYDIANEVPSYIVVTNVEGDKA
jgi:hypothetical protein